MATPLTSLGQALERGTRDRANITLSREAEERQRMQRLADVQSERDFVVGQRDRERGLALEDETRKRGQRLQDVTVEILIKEGWLNPAQANDPAAVQAAAARRAQRSAADLDRQGSLPDRLQVEADRLAEQDELLDAEFARVTRALSEPPPSPPRPDDPEVLNAALRLTGVPNPSEAQIAERVPEAIKAIYQQRFMSHQLRQQDAEAQIPILRSQSAENTRMLSFFLQQGVTPNRKPPAAVFGAGERAEVSVSRRPSMQEFFSQLDDSLAKRGIQTQRPAEPTVEAALPLAGPEDRQLLEQELTRQRAVDWTQTAAEPFNDATDRVGRLQRELEVARSPQPVYSGMATMAGPVFAPAAPGVRARSVANVLTRIEAARKEEEAARRRLLGVEQNAPLAPARRPVFSIP